MSKIKDALVSIGDYLRREIIAELIAQGHNLTGKLKDSIDEEIKQTVDKIELVGSMELYGRFLDEGVMPDQIKSPFAPARILGLTNWVKIKFAVDAKKAKGIAFAIATVHKRVGMPSRRGKFAPDKTEFFTKVFKKNESRITVDLEKAGGEHLNLLLTNLIRDTQRQFST